MAAEAAAQQERSRERAIGIEHQVVDAVVVLIIGFLHSAHAEATRANRKGAQTLC